VTCRNAAPNKRHLERVAKDAPWAYDLDEWRQGRYMLAQERV